MTILGRIIKKSLSDLLLHKWEQFLTFSAVVLIIFLASLLLMFLQNFSRVVNTSKLQAEFSVYWKVEAQDRQVHKQWDELKSWEGLKEIKTYEREEALKDLTKVLSEGEEISWLKNDNPIPMTALLVFDLPEKDPKSAANKIYNRLKQLSQVDEIHFNPMQLKSAETWSTTLNFLVLPFVGFLLLLIGLIIGNTFKITQMTKAKEIEVLSLVGASRLYIKMPLILGALLVSAAGTLTALVFLKTVQVGLKDITGKAPFFWEINYLELNQIAIILLTVCFVAIFSSWLALKR